LLAGGVAGGIARRLDGGVHRHGVLEKCFKNELTANRWLPKLKEMIPSYGESLIEDAALSRRIRADTAAVLHLENV
jgi:malate dehydrogenase (quinone)